MLQIILYFYIYPGVKVKNYPKLGVIIWQLLKIVTIFKIKSLIYTIRLHRWSEVSCCSKKANRTEAGLNFKDGHSTLNLGVNIENYSHTVGKNKKLPECIQFWMLLVRNFWSSTSALRSWMKVTPSTYTILSKKNQFVKYNVENFLI